MTRSSFIRHPKKTRFRRAVFQIHLWAGLAVGAVFTLVGLSGSGLLLWEELEQIRRPELRVSESNGREPLPLSELYQSAISHLGHQRIQAAVLPRSDDAAVKFRLMEPGPGRERTLLYVDPYSGDVLGEVNRRESWGQTFFSLHADLLSGHDGRRVNGYVALVAVLLSATGLIIWWPGRGKVRDALRIRVHGRWKRINWDLHNVAGFVVLALLGVQAFSALPMTFENEVVPTLFAWTNEQEPAGLRHDHDEEEASHDKPGLGPVGEERWAGGRGGWAGRDAGSGQQDGHDHGAELGAGPGWGRGGGFWARAGSGPDVGPPQQLDLDAVVAAARQAMPEGRPRIVFLRDGGRRRPNGPRGFEVGMETPGAPQTNHRPANAVVVRPRDAEVLKVERFGEQTNAARMLAWAKALHFGEIGGAWTRWLWALMGLTPGLLFFTGFVMWWNRVVLPTRKRWERERQPISILTGWPIPAGHRRPRGLAA